MLVAQQFELFDVHKGASLGSQLDLSEGPFSINIGLSNWATACSAFDAPDICQWEHQIHADSQRFHGLSVPTTQRARKTGAIRLG